MVKQESAQILEESGFPYPGRHGPLPEEAGRGIFSHEETDASWASLDRAKADRRPEQSFSVFVDYPARARQTALRGEQYLPVSTTFRGPGDTYANIFRTARMIEHVLQPKNALLPRRFRYAMQEELPAFLDRYAWEIPEGIIIRAYGSYRLARGPRGTHFVENPGYLNSALIPVRSDDSRGRTYDLLAERQDPPPRARKSGRIFYKNDLFSLKIKKETRRSWRVSRHIR